jgi:hypothetical protein
MLGIGVPLLAVGLSIGTTGVILLAQNFVDTNLGFMFTIFGGMMTAAGTVSITLGSLNFVKAKQIQAQSRLV